MLQSSPSSRLAPPPILSFEGTVDSDNGDLFGFLIVPPDTEGDIGRHFYIQMNNVIFEIFDKNTGASVLGPLANNIFFTGTGSLCELTNDGDPIVLYDHHARRWIFSQFALFEFVPDTGLFIGHQCFAVSKTPNPLGPYHLYDFAVSPPQFGGIAGLNDYPKIGVWNDAYHYSANEFEFFPEFGGFFFVAAGVVAFDKQAMIRGDNAIGIKFVLPFDLPALPIPFSLLPSHWEGRRGPGSGAPNIYWQMVDDQLLGTELEPDGYAHWAFRPDFNNPAHSTFTPLGLIPAPPFDQDVCAVLPRNCIEPPPPGDIASGQGLDAVDLRAMYRAQWRRVRKREAVVVSGTVDIDGNDTAGVRWAELKKDGPGNWFLKDTGTFAPADGNSRWMGSIAQDRVGNIALGYSVSGPNTFPSVRYTGRTRRDPDGEMRVEQECIAGTGAQIDSLNRWGDYSTMSVDPVDDCTFWYTQEYYETTSSFNWKTQVCTFHFPNCRPRHHR